MKKPANVEEQIKEKQKQIDELNNECAKEMAEIIGGKNTRILPYAEQTKLDQTIEYYTKKIAKLVVDIEVLTGKEDE